MIASASVFLDFSLPNATTWFYFSFLLAIALFFKFGRVLSIRNWDVVTLFTLAPGLLILNAQRGKESGVDPRAAAQIAAAVGKAALPTGTGMPQLAVLPEIAHTPTKPINWTWVGYLWILVGSGLFFFRCLFDLVLEQRPALAPNLDFGGLAWLAGAMFICLIAVAFRQPDPLTGEKKPPEPEKFDQPVTIAPPPVSRESVGRESAPLARAQEWFPEWLQRGFAGVCHFLIVVGLVVVGARHFNHAATGMAAAAFYLMLPYTGLFVSQVHHAWPMVLIVWAVAFYRYPSIAGFLFGLATGTAYFPGLAMPLWFSFYWRRGARRFLIAFLLSAGICLGIGLDLGVEGNLASSLKEAWEQSPWKSPSPTAESFWTGVHWAYRIPLFLAYVAFLVATIFWPAPKNLAHLIALTTALFIGFQFWYADRGGVYVLWYLPLLLLMVFRPNLSDRRPEPITADNDWLVRWRSRKAA